MAQDREGILQRGRALEERERGLVGAAMHPRGDAQTRIGEGALRRTRPRARLRRPQLLLQAAAVLLLLIELLLESCQLAAERVLF